MYQYVWDPETGGFLLTTEISKFSKEPRPVYYEELDILGFDKYWNYPKDSRAPLMWAEANNYIYKGNTVARIKDGALYNPPEIILLEEPEYTNGTLEFVDIERMVEKNSELMENLEQESILKTYNAYIAYKKKIDLYYVAFSGGKDSVVTLDLVQRALPHDDFKVIFSDTYMEFPDTYKCVEKVRSWCTDNQIDFLISNADKYYTETWKLFGPPATVTRWCCSVHKTVPQILLLRSLLNKPDFKGMAFVGVRGDESLSRSKYEYITYGGKHKGQYSCNVVLDWNSAEIYLYIYKYGLVLNDAYKKGNRRAGCLVCPRASERSEYFCQRCYPEQVESLLELIKYGYRGRFSETHSINQFIVNGGWKARKNGRDLSIPLNYKDMMLENGDVFIEIKHPRTKWKVWIKTIGVLANDNSPYILDFRGQLLRFSVIESDNIISVTIDNGIAKEHPQFIKLLKNVFKRAACCVSCRECQANCPYGCLTFDNGKPYINEQCHHCAQCHKVDKGCLIYKSLEKPKGEVRVAGTTMSLNSYSHHAPKMEWIEQYFKYKNDFDNNHTLGSQMYNFFKRFLRDAELLDKQGFSETAKIVEQLGLDNLSSWAIIFVNLCYAPQVGWFVSNTHFNEEYKKTYLASMMVEAGAKESWTNDIFSSLGRLCELPLGKVGLGTLCKEKNRAVSIIRTPWEVPDARVILYALYRFAESSDDCYQFSLDTLFDNMTEQTGISPIKIFGLQRDGIIRILNGLTVNYPDLISAAFTLNLSTITLRPTGNEYTSKDVLKLF